MLRRPRRTVNDRLASSRPDVYFDTAVVLLLLMTLARRIETGAVRQTIASLAQLTDGGPPRLVRRIDADGAEEAVAADDIRPGERVRVLAGEEIAVDGLICAGESRVDNSTLTVPLTFDVASHRAAQRGVLMRAPAAVERLARTDTVFFDKTGTLTADRLTVMGVTAHTPEHDASEVLRLAALAETGIAHSIAEAIREAAPFADTDRRARPHRQAGGTWLETPQGTVVLRNAAHLQAHGVVDLVADSTDPPASQVHLALAGRHVATLYLTAALRPEAVSTVRALEAMGYRCGILSGDSSDAVNAIGQALGIDPKLRFGDLSPEDKAVHCQRFGRVLFVGDGINDSPALASAQAGLAVSGAHRLAAGSADVAILRGGLDALPRAVTLARASLRVMRQNLAYALVYNAIALSLAGTGAVPPLAAALAMVASSLSITLNASRPLRGRPATDSAIESARPHRTRVSHYGYPQEHPT